MVGDIKVLFVGLNYRYFNPTGSLLRTALSRGCEVHFFGPGFVSIETLRAGIAAFARSLNGVDLIVATKDIVYNDDPTRLNAWLRATTSSAAPFTVTASVLQDINAFLKRHREKVVVSLLDVDVYAMPQREIERILTLGSYVIGWGPGALDFSGDDGDIEREPFIRRKRAQGLELGLYQQFLREHGDRVINVGFFVGEHEFGWGGLETRPVDVCVPGVRYYRRTLAYNAVKASGQFTLRQERFRLLFQAAHRLGVRPWSSSYGTNVYNLDFHNLLVRSKVGITDGGLINFTIRKFFEIPAAGAVLVCWPTREFERLGFRDGVNCLYVATESDVVAAAQRVVDDPNGSQAIASAGRELVLRRHSTTARGAQIHQAFQAILAGRFAGSHWEAGDFVVPAAPQAVSGVS